MLKYRFQYNKNYVHVADIFPKDLKDHELEELYSRYRTKY